MSINLQGLPKLAEFKYKKLDTLLEMKSQNIIKAYFPETSLANGFQGLTEIAKKKGIDPDKLKKGEMILFTNKAKTACKLYVAGSVLVYQKAPPNTRLIYSAILAIPRFFNGEQLDLKGAIFTAVRNDYDQRNWRKTGVVTKTVYEGNQK